MVLLILAIGTSSIIVFLPYTNSPPATTSTPFESKVTPFNITTTLRWDPFSLGGSFNYKISNLTITGYDKGTKIPFYATQLPFQPLDNVSYSVQVLNFTGPSNITIILSGNQVIDNIGISRSEDLAYLNPSANHSFTGILHISQDTFDEKYLFPNTTSKLEYEYNLFTIQPEPTNYPIWNHYLTLRVSLSGYENRPLFNYFRKIHKLSVWSSDDFNPLNMDLINSNLTKRSFNFAPVSEVNGNFSIPSWLIYVNNMSFIKNDYLNLKINLETKNPVKLEIDFGREIVIVGQDNKLIIDQGFGKSISYASFYNNTSIKVLLNWQETSGINTTVNRLMENQSDGTLNIYFSNQYDPEEFNTFSKNFTIFYLNTVSLAVINPSNSSLWDNRVNVHTDISWNPTNMSLPSNISLMYGNNGKENFSYQFTIGSITQNTSASNQLSFSTNFFFATIFLLSGKKFLKKRKFQ